MEPYLCNRYGIVMIAPEGSLLGRIIRGSGFLATTIGATIVIAGRVDSIRGSEVLMAHERRHVAQWMITGPLGPIPYLLASVWSRLRHGNWYHDNWFERDARAYAEAHAKSHR